MVEGFEDVADGALVVELVRRFSDIQLMDIQPLAGALYLQRDNDAQDRVIRVLELLLAKEAVVEDPETKCLAIPRAEVNLGSDAAEPADGPTVLSITQIDLAST
jgi:hypothetical protein